MATPSPIQDAPSRTRTSPTATLDHVFYGPFTQSRTKKLQHKVNSILCEIHYNNTKNYILPKLCMFLLLRFTKEDDKNTQRVDYIEQPHSDQSIMIELSKRISHNFCSQKLWRPMRRWWKLVKSSFKLRWSQIISTFQCWDLTALVKTGQQVNSVPNVQRLIQNYTIL
jgi:hypothetical protein